jgi:phosphoribosylformylglycinamidine synthase|tara:strand:+ start:105 stop:350 length:246 start_codon:yes stop_codon:yes gene_type:complete
LKISIVVTLKKEVLDPQGKVIQQTIKNMNLENITNVRQGKYFELELDEKNYDNAKSKVVEICTKLLTNPIIEDYKIINNSK